MFPLTRCTPPSRFSLHPCSDRLHELQEVRFLWNKPSDCHLRYAGDLLPQIVEVMCPNALQIIFTLLELRLGVILNGYKVEQLKDICFLPVYWSALDDRGGDNQLPHHQVG